MAIRSISIIPLYLHNLFNNNLFSLQKDWQLLFFGNFSPASFTLTFFFPHSLLRKALERLLGKERFILYPGVSVAATPFMFLSLGLGIPWSSAF